MAKVRNMNYESALAFWNGINCLLSLANLKLRELIDRLLILLRQIAFMARCKTDMLSGLIRKSPLAPLFPPGQKPYGPAAKEGDNNFPQRGNKGDFANCRSSTKIVTYK